MPKLSALRSFTKKHEGIFFTLFSAMVFGLSQWTIYTVKGLITDVKAIQEQVIRNTDNIVQINKDYNNYKNIILTVVPQDTFNQLVTTTDHRFSVLYSEDFDIDKKIGVLDGRVYTLETLFGSSISNTFSPRKGNAS